MRQVITKCYCLPPDIVKWLKMMAESKRRSESSILTEILLKIKKKSKTTK